MANEIVTNPEHGEKLIAQGGAATIPFQVFLDDLVLRLNRNVLGAAVRLPMYGLTNLPNAAEWDASQIYVRGGSTDSPAYSDGTNWRRVTDGEVVA